MASDSDSEEDFVTYGTPLEPLEEDQPLKKPIPIQEQTVKDEKGRYKRFHGAFTGGFSAGYFNTVGSKEGWTPSTFVSSRQQKAGKQVSRPEDFMDEEDFSEHGIAPREIITTDDFASERRDQIRDKARAITSLTAPIPGDNVLEDFVTPARTSVGVELLRKMGWKEGQGVGPRQKRKPAKQKPDSGVRVYGCSLPPTGSEESEEEEDEYIPENVTFAPKDITPIDFTPKDNLHGLGYKGLNPQEALMGSSGTGHINLFTLESDRASSLFGGCGPRNKRRGGVAGQAFGVGALEEDDDDIYHRDALSNYDTVLGGEEPGDGLYGWTAPQEYRKKKSGSDKDAAYLGKILDGFTLATKSMDTKIVFPPPELPRDYRPVHYFRPVLDMSTVSPQVAQALQASAGQMSQDPQQKGRHQLDASQRRELLGESALQGPSSVFDLLDSKDKERLESVRKAAEGRRTAEVSSEDRRAAMVAAGVAAAAAKASSQQSLASRFQSTASEQALSAWNSPTASSTQTFRPFEKNPHKQARYDLYISKLKQGQKDALESSLDPNMTEWERGRERDEFMRAAMLYKPSNSSLSSRFTRGKHEDDSDTVQVPRDQEGDIDDKQAAAKMKMFGKLTRDTFEWHPDKLLCKRFNIPDPYPGSGLVGLPKVKRDKFSVFNFLTLTDSSSTVGAKADAQCQSVPAAQHVTPKPAEPSKKSRWDVSAPASEVKDPLSEFLSVARSTASTLQQGQSSQDTPAPAADPATESKGAQQQEQKEEEEEEEKRPPMDLFKAIFASSSDEKSSSSSEGESEEEEEEEASVEDTGPQKLSPLNTSTNPPAPPIPTLATPGLKAPPVQGGSTTVPPKDHREDKEEFGPRLPPPSVPGVEQPSSSIPSNKEEKHKKKCKEKHKAKKDHKHKKEKKHKKKHRKHKHKGKQKKKKKAVEDSSSSDGSEDSDSDTNGGAQALSTEELLKRLKTLSGKKL